MSLKNLPSDAQPREKLLNRGPSALCDSELLAILLRTGTAGRGVLDMARELLERFGGIAGLLNTHADDLKAFKGLGGPAKRAELLAVIELARRALAQQMKDRQIFSSPGVVVEFLQLHLAQKAHEVFAVLFLDAHQRLIAMEELFRGTLTHTSVHPREVVVRTLHHEAASVVLAHNHPSGAVLPSSADKEVTKKLKDALALIDVTVIDHFIVAQGRAASMSQLGML